MRQNASYYLRTGSLILLVVIILGYSFFQARNLIFGPDLTIISPINGETYTDPLLDVKGVATNVNFLTLDDRVILTDTSGNFDEKLLLAPGYTIIKLVARNKFGKQTEKLLQVELVPQAKPLISPATTTIQVLSTTTPPSEASTSSVNQ